MRGVIINPFSLTRQNANMDDAWANMQHLLRDAELTTAVVTRDPDGEDNDGRWDFVVTYEGRPCAVAMPGVPLSQVRYISDEQNIWDFPRLYVDGDSWVWKYAISALRERLTSEENL